MGCYQIRLLLDQGRATGGRPRSVCLANAHTHTPAHKPPPPPPLHQNDPVLTSQALEALLAEWPLCYGYWKKLADAAAAVAAAAGGDAASAAAAVYERGLAAGLAASPDLWLPYAARLVADGASDDAVRR